MLETLQSGTEAGSLAALGAALAAGVATSLTPCIYPILPITIGVLGRAGGADLAYSRWRHAGHAALYILGLAATYAGLGFVAASAGVFFGAVATHPATLIVVANLLLLFVAWSMGWVHLPGLRFGAGVGSAGTLKKHQLVLMGALSGLVMGPCTAPVFGTLMYFVFSAGNQAWGALLLFAFSLGMSLVLAVAALLAGRLGAVPRSPKLMKITSCALALLVALAAEYLLVQAGRALL